MVEEVNIKISGEGAKKAKITTSKKKPAKKKPTRKKAARRKPQKRAQPRQRTSSTEKILIENFISMQKVLTGMAEKFDNLSKQISRLLKLFEDSAETLVEKDINLQIAENEDNTEMLEKLNKILDQNKIIAKGLTLMHETAVNPTSYYSLAPHPETAKPKLLPPMPQPSQKMTISKEIEPSETFKTPETQQNGLNKPKVFEEQENNFSGF